MLYFWLDENFVKRRMRIGCVKRDSGQETKERHRIGKGQKCLYRGQVYIRPLQAKRKVIKKNGSLRDGEGFRGCDGPEAGRKRAAVWSGI